MCTGLYRNDWEMFNKICQTQQLFLLFKFGKREALIYMALATMATLAYKQILESQVSVDATRERIPSSAGVESGSRQTKLAQGAMNPTIIFTELIFFYVSLHSGRQLTH